MRHPALPTDHLIHQRKRLTKTLKPNALAVLNANDIMPTNADGTMRFKQNSDLYFLTGVAQEETILMLCPDFPEKRYREILFLRETNDHIAVWEGRKLTKQEARELTGIQSVFWLSEFPTWFHKMMVMGGVKNVYLNSNEHYRAETIVQTRDARFIDWCKQKYPLHRYERIAPKLASLRSKKQPAEINYLQKACDITAQAFNRTLKFVKPGIKEYEIEAEYIHEFIRSGSSGFAYEPIVASGANSCILHYTKNSETCQKGDVILIDAGAEYGGYNADLTRTIPVSGKYSKRQRDVYMAVWKVLRKAIAMLAPGVLYYDYHKEVQKMMEAELINLKLISKTDIKNQSKDNLAVSKYFMHGTSHQLGLDVHDVGSMYEPMVEGQVWTVEPGIYIPEEKLGVRLENNVLITKSGTKDLMKKIPIDPDEIEAIMHDS